MTFLTLESTEHNKYKLLKINTSRINVNEYINLSKLIMADEDGHVQLTVDVVSFESILLMEHILKR
jgi:hypothetical protein